MSTTISSSNALESLARRTAPSVAILITLAMFTYTAGHTLGQALHHLNDQLAHNWPTRPATIAAPLAATVTVTGATVAVDRLAQQTIDVLALRAQGLSQRAIAEALGVSRTSVRRRLAAV